MIRFWLCILFLLPALAHAEAVPASGGFNFVAVHPAFALIGLAMIIGEFALPTKGVLGILGVAFFVLGTSALATTPNDMLRMTWPQIIALNTLVIGVAILLACKLFIDYNLKSPAVTDTLLNQTATVIDWTEYSKRVEIGGAIWLADSDVALFLQPGDIVTVTAQDNLTLTVSGE